MKRFVFKLLRVLNSNAPEVSNVNNGEHFTDIDGNLYYRRHDNGSIILVAKVNHTHAFNDLTGKPNSLSGYGITLASSDLPINIPKANILFGSGNSLATYGITLTSNDIPNISWNKITSDKPTTLSGYGITDAASSTHTHTFASITAKPTSITGYGITIVANDIPNISWNKITSDKPTTLIGYGIIDAANINSPTFLGEPIIAGSRTFAALSDGSVLTKDEIVSYVQQAVTSGLSVKDFVKAATTTSIALSGFHSPGGIDGYTLVNGDRILVKNQVDPINNGVYIVASGAWSRSADMDESSEVRINSYVFVENGATNAKTGWVITGAADPIIGTDSINFKIFSSSSAYIAGSGLSLSGNTFSLSTTGVAAGTYPKVTVDVNGRVTGGTSLVANDIPNISWNKITSNKPTTLSGYGITDAQDKSPRLTEFAGLTFTADDMVYYNGTALTTTQVTSFARSNLLNKTTVPDVQIALQTPEHRVVDVNIDYGNLSTVTYNSVDIKNVVKTISSNDNGTIIRIKKQTTAWPANTVIYSHLYDDTIKVLINDTVLNSFVNGFQFSVHNSTNRDIVITTRRSYTDKSAYFDIVSYTDAVPNINTRSYYVVVRPGDKVKVIKTSQTEFIVEKTSNGPNKVMINPKYKNTVIPYLNASTTFPNETSFNGGTSNNYNGLPISEANTWENFEISTSSADGLSFVSSEAKTSWGIDVCFSRGVQDVIASIPAGLKVQFNNQKSAVIYAERDCNTGKITLGSSTSMPVYMDDTSEAIYLASQWADCDPINQPLFNGLKYNTYCPRGTAATIYTQRSYSMRQFDNIDTSALLAATSNDPSPKFQIRIPERKTFNAPTKYALVRQIETVTGISVGDATSTANNRVKIVDGVFGKALEMWSNESAGLSLSNFDIGSSSTVATAPYVTNDSNAHGFSLWFKLPFNETPEHLTGYPSKNTSYGNQIYNVFNGLIGKFNSTVAPIIPSSHRYVYLLSDKTQPANNVTFNNYIAIRSVGATASTSTFCIEIKLKDPANSANTFTVLTSPIPSNSMRNCFKHLFVDIQKGLLPTIWWNGVPLVINTMTGTGTSSGATSVPSWFNVAWARLLHRPPYISAGDPYFMFNPVFEEFNIYTSLVSFPEEFVKNLFYEAKPVVYATDTNRWYGPGISNDVDRVYLAEANDTWQQPVDFVHSGQSRNFMKSVSMTNKEVVEFDNIHYNTNIGNYVIQLITRIHGPVKAKIDVYIDGGRTLENVPFTGLTNDSIKLQTFDNGMRYHTKYGNILNCHLPDVPSKLFAVKGVGSEVYTYVNYKIRITIERAF